MTIEAFYKKGKEYYSTLPPAIKSSIDLADKATKSGTDFDTFKKSESITRTLKLGAEKLEDFFRTNPGAKKTHLTKQAKDKIKKQAKEIAKEIEPNPKSKFKQGQKVYFNPNTKNGEYYIKNYGNKGFDIVTVAMISKGVFVPGESNQKKVVSYKYTLHDTDTVDEADLIATEPKSTGKKTVTKKPIQVEFFGKDDWQRSLYKSKEGTIYVDISDKGEFYTVTEGGEPYYPVKNIKVIKSKKQKASKPIAENNVELFPEEIKVLRRLIAMKDKEKTPAQVMALLDYLQKAIVEKRIRKTSEWAKEMEDIQNALITLYNNMKDKKVSSIKITISDVKYMHYKKIIDNYSQMKSISLIKRFISLDGEKQTKEKAQKLLNDVLNFQRKHDYKDKYQGTLEQIEVSLKAYLKDNDPTEYIRIRDFALNGFALVAGRAALKASGFIAKGISKAYAIAKPIVKSTATKAAIMAKQAYNYADKKIKEKETQNKKTALYGVDEPDVMTVDDVRQQKFVKLGLTGKYLKLIGEACKPTSIFIYGNGGSGKSSLSLGLADFLAKKGEKIIYVAGEQFNTPTFSDLLNRLKVEGGPNFKIVRNLNSLPLNTATVVVIDSKDSIGLLNSDDFKQLSNAYPEITWIITSQGTKANDFTGDGKWRNIMDTMIYCEAGVANTMIDKNRWGGKAKLNLFDS